MQVKPGRADLREGYPLHENRWGFLKHTHKVYGCHWMWMWMSLLYQTRVLCDSPVETRQSRDMSCIWKAIALTAWHKNVCNMWSCGWFKNNGGQFLCWDMHHRQECRDHGRRNQFALIGIEGRSVRRRQGFVRAWRSGGRTRAHHHHLLIASHKNQFWTEKEGERESQSNDTWLINY